MTELNVPSFSVDTSLYANQQQINLKNWFINKRKIVCITNAQISIIYQDEQEERERDLTIKKGIFNIKFP